jgi:hypothetical protein
MLQVERPVQRRRRHGHQVLCAPSLPLHLYGGAPLAVGPQRDGAA